MLDDIVASEMDFPEYPKIRSIFKRDEKTHKFIFGEFSLPEFDYLRDNAWIFTEKIDGTNIRVGWDGEKVRIGGKTDKAQMPIFLHDKLTELFPPDRLAADLEGPAILYGEGYGARIQKGGGKYIPDDVDFILFDVRCGHWWLKREDVESIAHKLDIPRVPIVGQGTLLEGISMVREGIQSLVAAEEMEAEGIVVKPIIELRSRNGQRIMTKLKHKDFEDYNAR